MNSLNTNVKEKHHYKDNADCSIFTVQVDYEMMRNPYLLHIVLLQVTKHFSASLTCRLHRCLGPFFASAPSCFGLADLANCCEILVKVRTVI